MIRDGGLRCQSPRSKSEPRSSEIEAIRHTIRMPTVRQRGKEQYNAIQHNKFSDATVVGEKSVLFVHVVMRRHRRRGEER